MNDFEWELKPTEKIFAAVTISTTDWTLNDLRKWRELWNRNSTKEEKKPNKLSEIIDMQNMEYKYPSNWKESNERCNWIWNAEQFYPTFSRNVFFPIWIYTLGMRLVFLTCTFTTIIYLTKETRNVLPSN